MNNRLWNCKNPHQGDRKKVLCVCSAGLLRSPTAAWILSNEPFGFNTRAVGLDTGHALVPIDSILLTWADEIVCMDNIQKHEIEQIMVRFFIKNKPVHNLNVMDAFGFRDSELINLLSTKLLNIFGE